MALFKVATECDEGLDVSVATF
ncbi:uncharacterized protein G2W53_044417 [Senna tora]|uniref:Uncharacterized protein n=1 Tax=Senna tora TaxID=362788 RepID=A0A834SC24_9FABA|nr:uncharacterized protein G2W53_044417 [Senna tora]